MGGCVFVFLIIIVCVFISRCLPPALIYKYVVQFTKLLVQRVIGMVQGLLCTGSGYRVASIGSDCLGMVNITEWYMMNGTGMVNIMEWYRIW